MSTATDDSVNINVVIDSLGMGDKRPRYRIIDCNSRHLKHSTQRANAINNMSARETCGGRSNGRRCSRCRQYCSSCRTSYSSWGSCSCSACLWRPISSTELTAGRLDVSIRTVGQMTDTTTDWWLVTVLTTCLHVKQLSINSRSVSVYTCATRSLASYNLLFLFAYKTAVNTKWWCWLRRWECV